MADKNIRLARNLTQATQTIIDLQAQVDTIPALKEQLAAAQAQAIAQTVEDAEAVLEKTMGVDADGNKLPPPPVVG